MTIDFVPGDVLGTDIAYGFIDAAARASRRFHPRVVVNDGDQNVLRVIRDEIKRCDEFLFSVAFVTPGAIAMLKQELLEFEGHGTIVTSDYLSFNSPRAFEELLNLRAQCGIDVRVHSSKAFHPKGYVFRSEHAVTAMMGSANLTKRALSSNHEWNLKVSAAPASDLAEQLKDLADRERTFSQQLTRAWVDTYAENWIPPARAPKLPAIIDADPETARTRAITPNEMQESALESIGAVRARGDRKAIVISATGTGKTILSALDVRAFAPDRVLFVVHREQILDRSIEEYRRVLGGDAAHYGKFTGSTKQQDRRYVFSTVQTLARHLTEFAPDAFDYIVIDEAHRAGAEGHRDVLTYFTPKFLLGMTATPERTDDFNVFELFDFNVPFEIRLQHALEAKMLSPFHYYGVADVTYADGSSVRDDSELDLLVTSERAEHVVGALEKYAQAGVQPRGLIFCSRVDEAELLSHALNAMEYRGRPLRTVALSGADSLDTRETVVDSLERGEIEYILTVDIFNEGVDIPSVNQIVMLRQTQSAIVFVQQLGRGLRKDPTSGKEYLVVIDFIGNYKNNYMIPIALFGDTSLNKESLRKELITAEERGVLPGLASVRFDKVAQERVLAAIRDTKLDSRKNLQAAIRAMYARLGRAPRLNDFVQFETADPVVLATQRNPPHFPALVAATLKRPNAFSEREDQMLMFLSRECFAAKRAHELRVVDALLARHAIALTDVPNIVGAQLSAVEIDALAAALTGEFQTGQEMVQYQKPLATRTSESLVVGEDFLSSYRDSAEFHAAVRDTIDAGIALNVDRYGDGSLRAGRQYSRKDACRLLGWDSNEQGVIYGYKVHKPTGTCPIFITLHKDEDVSASTAYEDELLDPSTVRWYTRSRRTLQSDEVATIVERQTDVHVFVKKDDAEGSDFYYLGRAHAADPEQTTMPGKHGEPLNVVRMRLILENAVSSGLYDYFHPTLTR